MKFDETIRENAYLNYAKLSYEIGNPYESTPNVLNNYLKLFPKSKHSQEIKDLLLKSYINSGNFAEASQLLADISDKSPELKLKEQEVAYAYGIQLYNQGKITEASQEFEKAKSLENNSEIYARSLYWNADCLYLLGSYQAAINDLNSFRNTGITTNESQQIAYQEGYSFLKLKNFDSAVSAFQEYLNNPKEEYKADAKLRLADALLGSNNLDKAITLYNQVSNSTDENGEYSQYQKAVIYGLKDDQKNKIIELEKFVTTYPKSDKIINAYFELGISCSETEDYKNSNLYFQKVIDLSKDNDLVAMSYLNRADNSTNQQDYQKAINQYGYIADQYPKTNYALQAVTGAKTAFIESRRTKEYEIWANKKGYSLSSSDAEELSFIAAEKEFLNKNYTAASQNFDLFLKKYPKTTREIISKYYLGESYFQTNQYNQAIKVLKPVASSPNEYQEEALLRLSLIYLKQKQNEDAKLALEALYKISSNEEYKAYIELELMYIYSDNKDYSKANNMAEKVWTNSKNSETVKEQANLIKARSLYFSNKIKEAKILFATLESSKNNAVKAETLYYNALFKNKEKKYDASNTTIFTLTSKFSDQQYWGAMALLIMSDNYHNLKDNYQATYILEQLIENYKEFPNVVEEAQKSLTKITK